MRYLLGLLILLGVHSAYAFCPYSESLLSSVKRVTAIDLYKNCAETFNDDASQVKLAKLYENGEPGVAKDVKKMFYYYQLSADNGNAESQTHLAQLYQEYDKTPESRRVLKQYTESIGSLSALDSAYSDTFKGELTHPYVLLSLAAEKPENKWYYPTDVLVAPTVAKQLLAKYNLDIEKKKALMRIATNWKKRKLLEIAKQVLPQEEFVRFSETLYPKEGRGDAFARSQALKAFKEKVDERKQQDAKSAEAFY